MKNKYSIDGSVGHIHIVSRAGVEFIVTVDSEDIPALVDAKSSWYINEYALGKIRVQGRVRVDGNIVKTSLHRFLLGFPEKIVDHIDSDALNNKKENLRLATKSENAQNYIGARKDNKLGILGVCWSKHHRKWQASIEVDGTKFRKYCPTIAEAVEQVRVWRKDNMPFSKEAMEEEE